MMIMLGEIGRGRVEHQRDTHTLTIHTHYTLPNTQNLPDNSTQHNVTNFVGNQGFDCMRSSTADLAVSEVSERERSKSESGREPVLQKEDEKEEEEEEEEEEESSIYLPRNTEYVAAGELFESAFLYLAIKAHFLYWPQKHMPNHIFFVFGHFFC